MRVLCRCLAQRQGFLGAAYVVRTYASVRGRVLREVAQRSPTRLTLAYRAGTGVVEEETTDELQQTSGAQA